MTEPHTPTYYKAIRPDGGSFYDRRFMWATEPGGITTHPHPDLDGGPSGYLSVATTPTDCTGAQWPCRLLEVEAVGGVYTASDFPNKRRGTAFRTLRELPAHQALGPQGEAVTELIERARHLTQDDVERLAAACDAAWGTARYAAQAAVWAAACDAARDAAQAAAWGAAWDASRDAARAAARDATRTATKLAARDVTRAATRAAARARAADRDEACDAAAATAQALVVADLVGQHGFTQTDADTLLAPWSEVIGDPMEDHQ